MTNECKQEIQESLNKNGYYVDERSIFSKCYNENVHKIVYSLEHKDNITNSINFEIGYNRTIGFYSKHKTTYIVNKKD